MSKINVLIFPAGEVNSVELHDALSTCVNVEVFGASSIDRHGSYVFKNYISGLPMITDKDFFTEFNEVILKHKIDLIFPTHDTIATFFAQNKDEIKAKVVVSDANTAEICRNKEKTYELFKEYNFCPKTYTKIVEYPVFIKPKEGQGSVGAKLITKEKDIPNIDLDNYIICEYLTGEEYTVDCLTDKNGELRVVSPRSRKRLMAGISVAGQTEPLTEEIEFIAKTINSKLNFMGLWCFQIKKDKNNQWKLLELATRCPCSMALTRARGLNLPLLSVYTAMGLDISISPNDYNVQMDSTLIRRYKIDYEYNTVYFDFDDTLIINEKVHLPAIRFLYQCKNAQKKVVLITKHQNEIFDSMQKHCIDKNLFDKIIQINMNENKADYVTEKSSIFIDNSFRERELVQQQCKIPVFDVSEIEVLLDWRY